MKTNEVTVGEMLTTRDGHMYLVMDKKENKKLPEVLGNQNIRFERIGSKERNNNYNWKWSWMKLKPITECAFSQSNKDSVLFWDPKSDPRIVLDYFGRDPLYTVDAVKQMKEKIKNENEVEELIIQLMKTEDWSNCLYDPLSCLAYHLRRDILQVAREGEEFAAICPKTIELKSDEKCRYTPKHDETPWGKCRYSVHCLYLEERTYQMCFYYYNLQQERNHRREDIFWENRIEFICTF